jgi:hypothetical protein
MNRVETWLIKILMSDRNFDCHLGAIFCYYSISDFQIFKKIFISALIRVLRIPYLDIINSNFTNALIRVLCVPYLDIINSNFTNALVGVLRVHYSLI